MTNEEITNDLNNYSKDANKKAVISFAAWLLAGVYYFPAESEYFYHIDDKDGDNPLDAKDIYEIYRVKMFKTKIERVEPTNDFNSTNSKFTRVCQYCDAIQDNGHEQWCPEFEIKKHEL